MKPFSVHLLGAAVLLAGMADVACRLAAAEWQAGTATVEITPEQPMWMAGYAGRDKPAEGALHPLWIKALALEDAAGHRAVVVSTDTLGMSRSIYENTLDTLKARFNLEPGQITLHSSHTHCGPVLRSALHDIYPLDAVQLEKIEQYSARLETQIVETVGQAFASMKPARLAAGQGVTRFAVNRRNNPEPEVARLRAENALRGPVDHDVPVLAVWSPEAAPSLRAVVFGYACHNTTLSFYQWCGDYAGFAQMSLERSHPEAVAMFYSGCGADQNPLPRRHVHLAERYGHMLGAAVEEVLLQPMTRLAPELRTTLEMVTLNLGEPPSLDQLEREAQGRPGYRTRWAQRLLEQARSGEPFIRDYPYPVQVWRLGERQLWIILGGEVVVDYALRFKQEFGRDTWVAGYANDVMAYIPSLRILREDIPPRASARWGYEGSTSMAVYGLPAERWAEDVEDLIAGSVRRQVGHVSLERANRAAASR